MGAIGEWSRREIQHCSFKSYDLIYSFYSKFPSWGYQVKLYFCAAVLIHIILFLISCLIFLSIIKSLFYSIHLLESDPSFYDNKKYKICKRKLMKTSSFPRHPTYFKFSSDSRNVPFVYLILTLFDPIFTFTAFESPLVLFSWWRNKISWEWAKNF